MLGIRLYLKLKMVAIVSTQGRGIWILDKQLFIKLIQTLSIKKLNYLNQKKDFI